MSIADQAHDKVMGILLNQIAFDFGVEELTPELEDKYYNVVTIKFTYEAEIQKILGPDSQMLNRDNVLALAEEITLENLYNVDDQGLDEISGYMSKYPVEMEKWHEHVRSLLD